MKVWLPVCVAVSVSAFIAPVTIGKGIAGTAGKSVNVIDQPAVKVAKLGTYTERLEDWTDTARQRTIPVRLFIPDNLNAPAPVVIFSHGLGGTRNAATYFCEWMAQHGYIVVNLQHAGSDSAVWRSQMGAGKEQILVAMKKAANFDNLRERVFDVKFALDKFEQMNESDAQLKGKIDLSKIAISGHSFGAGTSMTIAGQDKTGGLFARQFKDSRIKAAIYLSPPGGTNKIAPELVYRNIEIPGLLMTGTEDTSIITPEKKPEDRMIPFEGIKAPDQYLVNFIGGDHAVFGGGKRRTLREKDEQFHEMIKTVALAFLDAHLKGDASQKAWLQKDCKSYLAGKADYKFK